MVDTIAVVVDQADDILVRYGKGLAEIGAGKARVVMARAVNHTIRKANTQVKRALVRQTSAPRAVVESQVRMQLSPHNGGGAIIGVIEATGRPLSLRLFGPRQFSYGTRARVWGRSQRFPSAFMGPRPGVVAARLGGHVWARVGAKRMPIRMLFGPSLPTELVLDQSKAAFLQAAAGLAPRVGHELARILPR